MSSRCGKERRPNGARQHAAKCGEQNSIGWPKLRTGNLTLQHPQLVAENEDLDLLLTFRPHSQHEQLEQAPQRPIDQRNDDPQTQHLDR